MYYIEKKAEGEVLNLKNTANARFNKFEVLGNHEQETREGYNLLNNTLKSQTINGLTVVVNKDKSVSINGTATANTNIIFDKRLINTLAAGTYTLKDCQTYIESEENNGWWNASTTAVTKTFTKTPQLSTLGFYLYFSSGTTVNKTYYPALVKGTEEKPYEQYGATPSPEYPSPVICLGSNTDGSFKGSTEIKMKNADETQEKSYTLPIQQEMLAGDYFVKEEDGWKEVHGWNKIILTGNENLIKSGASSSDKLIAVLVISNGIDGFGYSNYFKYSETFGIGNFRVYNNGTNLAFGFDSTEIATLEEAKSFLTEKYNAGNPVYFYYKTVTPTKLACTPEQSAVLDELSNSYTYDEQTNIFSAEEVGPIFKVNYNTNISNEFKNRLLTGKITRAYLKVLATNTEPEMIIDESNYLKDLTFEELRYVPNEGFIGGTVAKRVTGNFNNVDSTFSIQDREFELYIGVDLEDETTEYIKYGTFIVQKPKDDQVTDNTSFEALDYMIKLNLPWTDRMTYPCTLKQLFDDLVDQSGLSTTTTSFLNQDFIVENNQFEDGTTMRDVLKAIAQIAFNWARIDESNNIVMDFEIKDNITETLTVDNYYNFTKQDAYGPVNVVILRNSQVEGENVTIKDEDGINISKTKNICNNNWILGQYSTTGEINTYQNRIRTLYLVSINPNTEYYLNTFNNNYNLIIRTYNKSKEFLRNLSAPETFTSNENEYYIGVTLYSPSDTISDLIELVNDGTIKPFICLNAEEDKNYVSYEATGEIEFVIADNPFAYTQEKRQQLIEAGSYLFGLTYVPMSLDTIGYIYLNSKDKIRTTNSNNESFDTYLLDHTITYDGTVSDSIESSAMTKTETQYQFTSQMIQALKHTELLVDKANQRIDAVIENVTENNEKLVELELTVDGIQQSVTDIENLTNTVEGVKTITLENCVEGNLLELHIYGNNTVFDYLYPRNDLYPSDNLYPRGDSRIYIKNPDLINICPNTWVKGHYSTTGEKEELNNRIRIDFLVSVNPSTTYYCNTFNDSYKFVIRTFNEFGIFSRSIGEINETFTTNENEYYIGITLYSPTNITNDLIELINNGTIKPFICLNSEEDKNYIEYNKNSDVMYDLGITEVLRQNGDVYDEYVLDNGKAKIIRRINPDGTIKYTETEEDLGDFNIPLTSGTNIITIKNYSATLMSKFAVENDLVEIFATKVEMNSSITQTAQSITLEVDKKINDTEQELNTKITQTAQSITLEVSEKVGEDEIISKINQSAEEIQIDAKKISLDGKEINLTGDNIVINSNNFSVDRNGNMVCNGAQINDATIDNAQINDATIDNAQIDDATMRNVYIDRGTIKLGGVNEEAQVRFYILSDTSELHLTAENLFLEDEPNVNWCSFGFSADTNNRNENIPAFNLSKNGVQTIGNHDFLQSPSIRQTSSKKIKKNISKLKYSALNVIKKGDIYEYNLISDENKDKKKIGFVIDDNYNTPDEIIASDKKIQKKEMKKTEDLDKAIDLYAMSSIEWKAIQEQQEMIESLKSKINELEEKLKN